MTQLRVIGLAAAALLLLLTYLLIQSAAPDMDRHQRLLDGLDAATLNDAAMQRDVLRARAGFLRNYDPLVESIENLRHATEALRTVSLITNGDANRTLDAHVDRLASSVEAQEATVEQFKSRNAVLQNSVAYFLHLSRQFLQIDGDGRDAVLTELGTLTNAMLRLTSDPRGEAKGEVIGSLERLGHLPIEDRWREDVRTLDAHGRLIVATLPVVDDLVSRLLAAPIAEETRTFQAAYLDVHGRAVAQANVFRALLYAAAVALAAYVAYLFARLAANARALQHRLAFERLISAISAQFINLPRQQINDVIVRSLGRLVQHMKVDQARIILDDRNRDTEPAVYGQPSARADASSAQSLLAAARGWRWNAYRRQNCIYVPDTARLPDGPERSMLRHEGIRSWLSVPMQFAGNDVGILSLESARVVKGWPDDDVMLLRTAGEMLATAIERRRIEEEQEALEARLHQAQKMEAVGTLAGGIAHEFNNILGAMLANAELAMAAHAQDDKAQRHLTRVMKAGERASSVINQILTFSRRGERRHRAILARPFVQEAVELLRASLPSTIVIRTDFAAFGARMLGDPAQLQQILINLCTNASHAMNERGTIDVGLHATKEVSGRVLSHGNLAAGDYIRLFVADAGGGIDAKTMSRIFEPFFTTKGVGSGTGLGLPTVHGIVDAHRGAIDVASELGRGTRFDIYFPQTGELAVNDNRAESSVPRGHGQSILLVDDENELVLLGEEMLAGLGYEPAGFGGGAAALGAFRADPDRFDLVLTDEVMPGMTGTELARAVHEIRPDVPIVLMTGYAGPLEAGDIQIAGVREIVRKPLLSGAIARCLARHVPSGAPVR